MHDLDRTMRERGYDYDREFDYEEEYSDNGEFDYENEYDDEYTTDYEADEYGTDYELDDEYDTEMGSPFSEEMESELAFELLSVNSDEELEEFLGKWLKKAWRGIKKVAPGVGRFLKKGLKGLAKVALPAVGTFFGGPVGGMVGGKLANAASNLFEIELEGLSPEDQEFEVAKRVIRYGNQAMQNAANLSQRMPPAQAANLALKQAAATHAPGMLKPRQSTRSGEGTWRRVGSRIVLSGVYGQRWRP